MNPVLSYRPLEWRDSGFCRELASDPAVRAVSLNQKLPTFFGHLRWMSRQMTQAAWMGTQAWVILEKQWVETVHARWKRVGLLRAASLPGGGCEVSIALLASARGRGIGSQALREFTPNMTRAAGAPAYARIKLDNATSIAAFLRAGYGAAAPGDWERISGGQHGVYVLRWPKEE